MVFDGKALHLGPNKFRLGPIRMREADRFFPSSKTCSACGAARAELNLGERVFHCQACGLELDRDLNAAVNLLNLLKVPVSDGELGSGQARAKTPVERKALAATFAVKPRLAEAGTYEVSYN